MLELDFTYFVFLTFMEANEMLGYLFELESKAYNNLTYENKKKIPSKYLDYSVNKIHQCIFI